MCSVTVYGGTYYRVAYPHCAERALALCVSSVCVRTDLLCYHAAITYVAAAAADLLFSVCGRLLFLAVLNWRSSFTFVEPSFRVDARVALVDVALI